MSYGMGKNSAQGKIARLPAALREALNLRLLDGENGRITLDWLNNQPEVCGTNAANWQITDQNLSNWRKGEWVRWRNRRESLCRTKDMAQFSVKIAQAAGGNLTEGAAAILSGKILDQLENLDAMLSHIAPAATSDNSDPSDTSDTAPDPALIKSSVESLATLAEALNGLRAGDQNNRRLAQNDVKLALYREKQQLGEKSLKLEEAKFQRLTCAKFIDWAKNEAALKIVTDTVKTNSQKIAELGPMMFGELWKQEEEAA
jgi:hypothetical protein